MCEEKAMKNYLDGSGSTLYMTCHRPVPNTQGMAIWGDCAFMLYDTGVCAVFDLKSRNSKPLDVFPLGSYNAGKPTRDYLNHANSCMFGATHWEGNPIPLLYVTIGTGIGTDENGYFYRCAVENIVEHEDGTFTAQTVQTISYRPEGTLPAGVEQPCWGNPCIMVDNDEGCLYIFSARYRTKRECIPEGKQNAYIITKFPLPDPQLGGMIHLKPEDILDQFSVPSDVLFTQGGTIANGKLYYTYGYPQGGYPVEILVFDLQKKCLATHISNLTEAFRQEEIECCDIYQGQLLCNTCAGSIFKIEEGLLPL